MQGKVRVEVLEKMFVMMVLLLAKFCSRAIEVLVGKGREGRRYLRLLGRMLSPW